MLSRMARRRGADGASCRWIGRNPRPVGTTVLLVALAACGPAGSYSRGGGTGGMTGAAGAGASDAGGSGGILVGSGGGGAPVGGMGGSGGQPTGMAGHGGGLATGGSGAGGDGLSPGTGGGIAGGHGGSGTGSGGTAGAGIGGRPSGGGTSGVRGSGGAGMAGAPGGAAGMGSGMGGGGVGGAGGAGGAATGGTGSGGVAGPRIISVDFVGGAPAGGASGTAVMGDTEVAGVKPVSHWNSAAGPAGSLLSLKVADATVVTASFSWSSPVAGSALGTWAVGYTDVPGDARMMNGYLDPGDPGTPARVMVSGLPSSFTTGAGYDIYLYVTSQVGNGTRTYHYAVGSTAFDVTQTGPSAATFPGYVLAPSNGGPGNYMVFRRMNGSSFTLTATPGTGPGTQTRAPVNGLQIVAPAGS
jgi:hypothetical protein